MWSPTRRRFITGLAAGCAALGLRLGPARALQPAARPVLGAIRWDAWYDPAGPVGRAVEDDLAPPPFQSRMPFFGVRTPSGAIVLDGNHQAIMDQEIRFAAFAKIDYWAYCWYPPESPMRHAWALHQSSSIRDQVNWCMLWQFSNLGGQHGFAVAMPDMLAWMAQPNYQRVLGGRPVVFLFIDQPEVLDRAWGGDWATLRRSLDELRKGCVARNLAPPYVVVQQGRPEKASQIARDIGGDAISSYIGPVPHERYGSFADLDDAMRRFWEAMAATSSDVVPIAMTGWDQRPRKLHPPFFWRPSAGDEDPAFYIRHGSPDEIADQIAAALTFTATHAPSCPAGLVLVYSWNECDEGGSTIIPPWGDTRVDTSLVDALHAIR